MSAPTLRLVFWETTAGCNLACGHCRRLEVSRELSKQDLTTREGQALIDGVAAVGRSPTGLRHSLGRHPIGSRHSLAGEDLAGSVGSVDRTASVGRPVLVFSGGEPLMRPDWFELAGYARSREVPIALATNGTLVDAATAERIAHAGFERVAISLDGAEAATHDAFRRQPGAFERSVDGLQRLQLRRLSLQINTTVTRHNVGQLEALYDLVRALGVDAWHLFMFVPVGCGLTVPADQQLASDQYERVLQWLAEKARLARPFVRATCAPQYFRILAGRRQLAGYRAASRLSTLTKGCLAGTGICFVSHTGEVFPCGYLPVSCGNVRSEPLASIWESSFVLATLRDPDFLKGKCRLCEFRQLCSGCRARAYAATGDYLAEEPCCAYQPKRRSTPLPLAQAA